MWCVRSSPVSLNRLYFLKYVGLLAILLCISEGLVLASDQVAEIDANLKLLSAVAMAFVALVMTSLHLGGGAYFASYKEKNPIRVASSQGASLTFLISIIYLVVVTGLLWLSTNRYFEGLIMRRPHSADWFVLPVALIGIISLLCSIAATWVGVRSFKSDY